MSYRVIVESAAQKQIKKLGFYRDNPVVTAILDLRQNPRPQGAIKLVGHDYLWRVRADGFRIIYSIDDAELIVKIVRVVKRSEDTYRDLRN